MQYKGHELKEITEPQIFDPPKKMLVWDDGFINCYNEDVLAITHIGAIATRDYGGVDLYDHCAEIPEEPKPRRATNREMSKWLAHGNGECLGSHDDADTAWNYPAECSDDEVREGAKIRKWDDAEWHEPTVDYMGLEA